MIFSDLIEKNIPQYSGIIFYMSQNFGPGLQNANGLRDVNMTINTNIGRLRSWGY